MHPPGTIIVPTNGMIRHVPFIRDLLQCDRPEGTKISFPTSGLVTQNLNRALSELHGEWAWLHADDHAFKPDLLTRLLDHEADIVCPLIVRRFNSDLVFGDEAESKDELNGRMYPAYVPIALDEVPDKPFTVEIAGTGGMLIRKRVFDALEQPYFESTDGAYLNEDIEFSRRVRAAGFEILVDPNAHLGHIVSRPLWPI